ncbi:MAG TPA: DUF3572 domain-containing protein [Aurantimonas sp.]|nr:DUF3572 domain-containing protein [Aurantimonas sp.]
MHRGGQTGREAADLVAVQALAFIAADRPLLDRFLAVTGINVADLRAAAATPGFLAGVLDFVLAHEPTLMAFAADQALDPARVAAAREALSASFGVPPR